MVAQKIQSDWKLPEPERFEEIPEFAELSKEDQNTLVDEHVSQYLTLRRADLLSLIFKENEVYVRAVVRRVPNTAPSVLDFDDLYSSGMVGLLSAINKYDPSVGTHFRSFAFRRIYGSAMDAVRSASSTSRCRDVQFTTLEDIYAAEDTTAVTDSGLSPKASEGVRKALMQLPLRQALVLLLSINNLPVVQIAAVCGVSTSQVTTDKERAMMALRPLLIDFMGEVP